MSRTFGTDLTNTMLGKRRGYDFGQRNKRQRRGSSTAASTQRPPRNYNYNDPVQYGAGYDPKFTSSAPAPAGAEKKYFDVCLPVTTLPNAGTNILPAFLDVGTLVNIPRGDSNHEREGAKITVTGLDVRFEVGMNQHESTTYASVFPAATLFRIFVYIDTQCNGGAAPLTTLFEATNTSDASTLNVFNNLQNTGRFKTLIDKYIITTVPPMTFNTNTHTYNVGGSIGVFKKHITLNLPIRYSGDAGSITNITTNNIGVLVMSNYSQHHKVSFRTRVRYLDY